MEDFITIMLMVILVAFLMSLGIVFIFGLWKFLVFLGAINVTIIISLLILVGIFK